MAQIQTNMCSHELEVVEYVPYLIDITQSTLVLHLQPWFELQAGYYSKQTITMYFKEAREQPHYILTLDKLRKELCCPQIIFKVRLSILHQNDGTVVTSQVDLLYHIGNIPELCTPLSEVVDTNFSDGF